MPSFRVARRQVSHIVDGNYSMDGKIHAWIEPQPPADGTTNNSLIVNLFQNIAQKMKTATFEGGGLHVVR